MKKLITIHLLTLIAFGGYAYHNYNKLEPETIKPVVEINGIDYRLINSIIHFESSGNPLAVSNQQAYGLMQLRLPTAKQYCGITSKEELFKPHLNINCGTEVLKAYMKIAEKRGHGLKEALKYYNAGPWNNNKNLGEKYAINILNMYGNL